MQLEIINENSFFCYLNSEDLSSRQLTPDDLHYGNANARKLFTEIIERAKEELHFQRKDLPLMIEAVPMQEDELFLQITRIEEAEELEPRFAQFAPSILDELEEEEEDIDFSLEEPEPEPVNKPSSKFSQAVTSMSPSSENTQDIVLHFNTYDHLIMAVQALRDALSAKSALYYNKRDKSYHLILKQLKLQPSLALLYEYAAVQSCTPLRLSFIKEHFTCIIPNGALKRLRESLNN